MLSRQLRQFDWLRVPLENPSELTDEDKNMPFRKQDCTLPNALCHTTNGYQVAENPLKRLYYKVHNRVHPNSTLSHQFNYFNAIARCEDDGTHLALPRSLAENNFIAEVAPDHVWLGINDIEEEGQFKTVDGSDFMFDNWKTRWPPENSNAAQYYDGVVLLKNSGGLWIQADPDAPFSFVCLDSEEFLSRKVTTEDDDESQYKLNSKNGLDVFPGSLVSV